MTDLKKFMVIVRDDKATYETLPNAKALLEQFGQVHLIFNDKDGTHAGLLVRTTKVAAQISAKIDGLIKCQDKGFIFVFEIGDDFRATGNASGWRHVQDR